MTTYKEIHGTNIEVVSSDPSNPLEGQVWYNSTSNVVKYNAGALVGSWSTAANMLGNSYDAGMAGTATAAIAMGGAGEYNPGGTKTFSWNGSWSIADTLPVAKRGSGRAGSSTSALYSGTTAGGGTVSSSTWNGSSWTAAPDMNTPHRLNTGAGSSNTDALVISNYPPQSGVTEYFNGSWTNVNPLNNARFNGNATGATGTSALMIGGTEPRSTYGIMTESWNGSSWTNLGNLNVAKQQSATSGTQTSALAFGGETNSGHTAASESWNGSSWTTAPSLNLATRNNTGDGASNTSAVNMGGIIPGSSPDVSNKTETFAISGGIQTLAAT